MPYSITQVDYNPFESTGGFNIQEVDYDPFAGEMQPAVEPDEAGVFGLAARGLASGAVGIPESAASGLQWLGNRLNLESVTSIGKKTGDYLRDVQKGLAPPEELQKSVWDNPELLINPDWWAYEVPRMGASLAATLIPGGAVMKGLQVLGTGAKAARIGGSLVAGIIGGEMEGSQTYQQMLQETGDEEKAARAGELQGIFTGILNSLGASVLLKKAAGKGIGKRLARGGIGFAAEGTTESLEEPAEEIAKGVVLGLPSKEILANAGRAYLQRGLTVFPIAGVTGGGAAMMSGVAAEPTEQAPDPQQDLADIKAGLEAGTLTPEQATELAQSPGAQEMGIAAEIADLANEYTVEREAAKPLAPEAAPVPTEPTVEPVAEPIVEPAVPVEPTLAEQPEVVEERAERLAAEVVEEREVEKIPTAAPRLDLLPPSWKVEVGLTRTKEGHTAEAEVDWRGKRIVFADKKHMHDPDIINHEIGHVLIETLPEKIETALLEEYVELKKAEWKDKGYEAEWIVKNHFHREEIAMDYGIYLTNPENITSELKTLFEKHLPHTALGDLAKPPELKPAKAKEVTGVQTKFKVPPPSFGVRGKKVKGKAVPTTAQEGLFEKKKEPTLFEPAAPYGELDLSKEVLAKMNTILKNKGYDVRGSTDIKQMIKKSPGILKNPDWADAYERATGVKLEPVSKIYKKSELKNINWERIRELGKTTDIREAGYISPDGSMIDLSGKREGGPPGTRGYDHREAGGTDGMQELMALGHIRMDVAAVMLDMAKKPTPKQVLKIRVLAARTNGALNVELEDGLGEYSAENNYYRRPERTFDQEYPEGTPTSRILSDINRFYAGKEPVPIRGIQEPEAAYGSTEKADTATLSTGKAVERAYRKRTGVSDLTVSDSIKRWKSSFAQEFVEKKHLEISGRKLTKGREAHDIADIFQVYRTPKQENLVAVLTARNGTILSHTLLTSGQLNYVKPKNVAQYCVKLQSQAKRLGAANVHFIHNHPAGNPEMSTDDVKIANYIRDKLGGSMGEFVVINHSKFTFYVPGLGIQWGDYVPNTKSGNWLHGKIATIRNQAGLASFIRGLDYDKNKIVIGYVSGQNHIHGWSVHNQSMLLKPLKKLRDIIGQQAKAHDAPVVFIAGGNAALSKRIAKSGIFGGFLLDIQDANGVSYYQEIVRPKEQPAGVIARAVFEPEAPYGYGKTKTMQEILDSINAAAKRKAMPPHKAKNVTDKVGAIYNSVTSNWRTRTVDRLYPLMQKLDQGLDITDPDMQAYIQGRMDSSAPTVVATFLQHGKLKWLHNAPYVETKDRGFLPLVERYGANPKTVDSYDSQVQALLKDKIGYKPKSIRDIDRYLFWKVASRAEKLTMEGREHLFTHNDIALLKNIAGKNWKDTALDRQYVAFNKNVLDFVQQIGLIDPSMRKVWEHDEYIPFYRILEDELLSEEFLKAPIKTKKFIDSQIKKLVGGTEKLGDPFENILRNWSHLITESIRNRTRTTAYNYMEQLGYAEPSKPPKYTKHPEREAILNYLVKGKRKYFKVKDLELFNALSGANIQRFDNILMRMFGRAKRMLTYGATFGPAFRVANFMRDTLQTAMVNKSFVPVWNSLQGVYKAYTENADYIAMMSGGGGFSLGYVRGDDPQATARHIRKVVRKAHKKSNTLSPLNLLEWWEKIGSASENAARVQLYANLRKKGVTHLVAGFKARDVLDFSLSGDSHLVQTMVRTMPFLGARMQGLYKMGRAYGEDKRAFLLKGAILAGLSLAWWAAISDDDRYKELEDWEKWTYRHFWIGDTHFRIPRAFEVDALFSSSVESMADVLSKNEEGKHVMHFIGQTMRDTFALDVPQLVRPLYEQAKNEIGFTGRPIISESLKNVKPEDQAQPWTSESLRVLGGKLGVSPLRAEALVRGYLATLGMFILGATDVAAQWAFDFPSPPRSRIDNYPLLGRFIREAPARHTKYVTRFYEMAREMDVLVGTINHYKRTGDIEKAIELSRTSRVTKSYKKAINRVRLYLRNVNARIKVIHYQRNLTATQKKERINKLLDQRNQMIKRAYESLKSARMRVKK